MLLSDLSLNELVLGQDVWIVRVAMRMEFGEVLEAFVCSVVVAKPSLLPSSVTIRLNKFGTDVPTGDSGNVKMRAARNNAGTIWKASGMRHSLLSPVPVQVM